MGEIVHTNCSGCDATATFQSEGACLDKAAHRARAIGVNGWLRDRAGAVTVCTSRSGAPTARDRLIGCCLRDCCRDRIE